MTDKEMAEEYADRTRIVDENTRVGTDCISLVQDYEGNIIDIHERIKQAYLAGLKTGRPQWHKIFEREPYCYEYWDLPQDRLPKIENFYFVKLKNGFIKICELQYDHWSRKKCFYDLHGGKQSNVAEWLDYPTTQGE